MQYEHKKKMHRPKGSMCQRCAHATHDCSDLAFAKMPAIGKDRDGLVIVRCTEYKQIEIHRMQPNARIKPLRSSRLG